MDPLIEKQSILRESGKNAQSFHKKTPKWPKSGDSVPLRQLQVIKNSNPLHIILLSNHQSKPNRFDLSEIAATRFKGSNLESRNQNSNTWRM